MINLFFGRKTKVLIVNDSRKEAGELAGCLPSSEFRVIKAETAHTGFEAAARERPEIILLDSELRCGSSWETLDRLKNTPKTSSIPVLICTPAGDQGLAELANERAQGCIPKPLKREVVVTRIARRLNRSRGGSSRKSYF